MDKYEIARRIEEFAPLELAEKWDCSGWLVDVPDKRDVTKIMLCLTVTNDIIKQARKNCCNMIISHHPLFSVPLSYQDIDIYCAHTNLDSAEGGTTDTLIKKLGLAKSNEVDFLRFVDLEIPIENFTQKLKTISPKLRYVNNFSITKLHRIAFCAGSGAEFINLAQENGADALVTGDLKFHAALDSEIVLYDIGHFESEIIVLPVIAKLLSDVEIIFAKEKSPFL